MPELLSKICEELRANHTITDRIIEKKTAWEWIKLHELTFDESRKDSGSISMGNHRRPSRFPETILSETDKSTVAIGGELFQIHEDTRHARIC